MIHVSSAPPCPACGGVYRVKTLDAVMLCVSCWAPQYESERTRQYVIGKAVRGVLLMRTPTGFEVAEAGTHGN